MSRKRGFTIIELMVVVGIIAILMTIITTAAASSMRASRTQRTSSLCMLVQTGLATYREQENGKWPVSALNGAVVTGNKNGMGANGTDDPNIYLFSAAEVRQAVKALVDKAKQNSPCMDISGLFVAREDNELTGSSDKRHPQKSIHGMDFMTAIRGSKTSKKKMSSSEMYFGYPDPETGCFLRFRMYYSIAADQITVTKQE